MCCLSDARVLGCINFVPLLCFVFILSCRFGQRRAGACEFLVLWSRANCIVILQVLMRILAPQLTDDFADAL